uniref:Uncharacterized protein n=1 Tax=Anguilla anguilla TaxID=7936 RepID=A0A0E9RU43_ANGAN
MSEEKGEHYTSDSTHLPLLGNTKGERFFMIAFLL